MQSTNVKVDAQAAPAPVFQRPSGSGGGNKKGTSAERRATHNAIERARRESLNGRFLQLAASLPAISDVRRPSKSLIVNKSLDFVADAMNRESIYRLKIDNMRQENAQLRQQLNKFLAQAGMEQLPPPSVDELPVPMAEMGNKKRSTSLSGSGPLTDIYDLDDDDGPFAAGSEGEGGKTSPTSSCSAASSVHGSVSSSLPAGVTGFTPISHGGVYSQPHFLSTPTHPAVVNGTSPGASSGSEDIASRERSAAVDDPAGNWMHASTFDGQALHSAGPPAQQLTYAGLAFSSTGPNNGLVAQASPARPGVSGLQQFAPLGLDHSGVGTPSAGSSGASGLPAVVAQNGQTHMFPMNANNYLNLRNAQQLQPQQQQQLQFQLQLQHHHHQQQVSNLAQFNQSSFFEQAPLQSASFMTVV
ncbi:uncharacterized protein MEPE_01022 [Melanopsichium pennsylvanicum]|uniref:BHLH domain-containing protein n=2 Tax=Melanopsichium pennsylvanicum TaxID=63383 RepID=A0AAJ4XIH4_9BASI|nr:uncharacterized protein MEPE_01022 [Melanopsichium pennsylvanicum]